MSQEIEERVRRVIGRTFQIEPSATPGELRMGNPPSWDSVGHMGLILELEDEFGLTFPTYEVANLQTAAAIVSAVARHTGS